MMRRVGDNITLITGFVGTCYFLFIASQGSGGEMSAAWTGNALLMWIAAELSQARWERWRKP